MKYTKPFAAFLFVVFIVGLMQQACRKTDEDPASPPGNVNLPGATSTNADSLSDHLLFDAVTKRSGIIPSGPPSNGSIQISIKDTLYLVDQLPRVIKFRHIDVTKNVSGVFIQVLINGSASTFYYDVPELKNMSSSDTISVITIGINPADLRKPQTAEIKIVPYDKNKQPIVQITRPLKVDEKRVDLSTANSCGLDLGPTMYWSWECSFTPDNIDAFFNTPGKVHSPEGQDIQGSCCNGFTRYPTDCPGDTAGVFRRRLHFATYYQINFETFQFFGSGTFLRVTEEDSPVPLPAQSNFCAGGNGLILPSIKDTRYNGNWTISRSVIPPNKPTWLPGSDSLQLTLRTTSSIGTGFGNPGGIIHQLDCKMGSLVLVQLSREGSNGHLIKVYGLRQLGENLWHE